MVYYLLSYSDIDECLINGGPCEQRCTNIVGSFQCSCYGGYELESNGINCSGNFKRNIGRHSI